MKSFTNQTDVDEILSRLARLQPNAKPLFGRMSPGTMLCHVSDSLRSAMGGKSASSVENWFMRTVVKWIALRAPIRWRAGFPTRPEMDPERGGTRPTTFHQDRASLMGLTRRFAKVEDEAQFARHPAFGKMTRAEWMRWGYLHADHHLRQFGV